MLVTETECITNFKKGQGISTVFSQGFDVEVATLEVRVVNMKYTVCIEFWEFTNTCNENRRRK